VLTHDQLCKRAKRWLRGTRRCNPVFSQCASCSEIPDAIGWSSCHSWYGSTVIECKTSLNDFRADKSKYLMWQHPEHKWKLPGWRIGKKEAAQQGYTEIVVPSMGDYRFFMCEIGVLTEELVTQQRPDHGLLALEGRAVRMLRPAPKREVVDKDSEIRFLRFAIINGKEPHVEEETEESGQLVLSALNEK
jgi:hypothetical protein